ncbi:mandelate racemase/muconate lactonizing enzyme family protein [Propylenella binzhouense]|uniref:Mandelate racemase/muconate lactonizing enzyme family protein n=1 Tax=Propylenella binzhouense TaxID=2555902 RepID=A0A964T559_9HYPH|nr:mandelate racemase/muconate lactonizing enzyme family protein [Propylenella binzhouense]MYZ48044.1 mandelate racemase/muconate lactonizing enzyme family protein [Propylenella binzhouense]
MRIARIAVTRHRLPLDPPFRPSWDFRPRRHFDATIVRVATDEGLEGVGSGDDMLGFEAHAHLFLGEDPLRVERHARILANIQFHYGRCWPLDLALWDLAGKIAGQPVWKLLGGRADRLSLYASSATLRDSGAMAEAAERYLAAGFRALKLRFHRADWREDIGALEAVRARLGDRMTLMVDCNQGWRMAHDDARPWGFKDALAVARELERLGVYWMEEPLHRADRTGMRTLREATDVRIAGGEMNRELHEFRDLVEARALDVLQPDAALVGGITGLRRVAAMAEEAGLLFTPHTWTNGIGLAANLHLAAGIADPPFVEFPLDLPEWGPERRDFMLAEPIRADGAGTIVLSDAPGLGIRLDEERLAATRIG